MWSTTQARNCSTTPARIRRRRPKSTASARSLCATFATWPASTSPTARTGTRPPGAHSTTTDRASADREHKDRGGHRNLRLDQSADALVGEQLDHHAMRLAAVDHVHGFHAALEGAQDGLGLHRHAALEDRKSTRLNSS